LGYISISQQTSRTENDFFSREGVTYLQQCCRIFRVFYNYMLSSCWGYGPQCWQMSPRFASSLLDVSLCVGSLFTSNIL